MEKHPLRLFFVNGEDMKIADVLYSLGRQEGVRQLLYCVGIE